MSPSHSGSDQGAYRRISLQGGNCLKLDNMRRAIAGEIFVSVLRDWSINIREFASLKSSSSPRAWPASWARVSPTSIPGGSPFWGSRERQHRSEIYPMGVIAPHDFRAGCAHHLQWRQAVTRKAVPTKIAPMPPTVAQELPPERLTPRCTDAGRPLTRIPPKFVTFEWAECRCSQLHSASNFRNPPSAEFAPGIDGRR
jgi:hypothetical protein